MTMMMMMMKMPQTSAKYSVFSGSSAKLTLNYCCDSTQTNIRNGANDIEPLLYSEIEGEDRHALSRLVAQFTTLKERVRVRVRK